MTKKELLLELESRLGLTLKPSDESGTMYHLLTPTGIAILDVYVHTATGGAVAFGAADWSVPGDKLDELAARIAEQLFPKQDPNRD